MASCICNVDVWQWVFIVSRFFRHFYRLHWIFRQRWTGNSTHLMNLYRKWKQKHIECRLLEHQQYNLSLSLITKTLGCANEPHCVALWSTERCYFFIFWINFFTNTHTHTITLGVRVKYIMDLAPFSPMMTAFNNAAVRIDLNYYVLSLHFILFFYANFVSTNFKKN